MRVCLTVQGEQPIKRAASEIVSGGPSRAPTDSRNGICWPGNGRPGSGQWGGQCCPPVIAEKGRKCAGLAAPGHRAFGAEAELRSILEFGSLMVMVVLLGASEQSG